MKRAVDISFENLKSKSEFRIMEGGMLYLRRELHQSAAFEQTVAYDRGWCTFTFDAGKAGEVQYFRSGEWHTLPPTHFVIVPPYSLIHWRFPQSGVVYTMRYTLRPYPAELPKEAVSVADNHPGLGYSAPELIQRCAEAASLTPIERVTKLSPLARQAKRAVLGTFHQNRRLGDVFKDAGLSPTAASRAFRSSHGISAVHYRTLLRVMRAQELLLLGETRVTDVGYDVGFNDLSQFHRQFTAYAGVSPGSYLKNVSHVKKINVPEIEAR